MTNYLHIEHDKGKIERIKSSALALTQEPQIRFLKAMQASEVLRRAMKVDIAAFEKAINGLVVIKEEETKTGKKLLPPQLTTLSAVANEYSQSKFFLYEAICGIFISNGMSVPDNLSPPLAKKEGYLSVDDIILTMIESMTQKARESTLPSPSLGRGH